jgi:hypothetical protein
MRTSFMSIAGIEAFYLLAGESRPERPAELSIRLRPVRSHVLLSTAKHEGSSSASFCGLAIDLGPESDEIVHGGDDRDSDHEPDGHSCNEIDRDDEIAEIPGLPVMVDNRRHYADDLHNHFQLAEIAGLDGKPFGRSDAAQSAYQELTTNDDYRYPGWDDARIELHQRDESRGNHQFVRQRIEQHAHGGHLATFPRQVAIEAIGDGGQDEQS